MKIFKIFFVLNTLFFKGLAFLTISDGSMSTQFTNEMDFRFSNHKFIAKVFLLLTLKQFFFILARGNKFKLHIFFLYD